MPTQVRRYIEEEGEKEVRTEEVEELMKKILEMVRKEVSVENTKNLLFNRNGELYSQFPSKKVKEWALKKQKEYGLDHDESDLISTPLLYAAMRRVYKELEFDLGRNVNVGWVLTTDFDVKTGLKTILAKKLGLKSWLLPDKVDQLIDKYHELIERHCERVAAEVRRELTGGASLGALRWYKAMGYPREIAIISSEDFDKFFNSN